MVIGDPYKFAIIIQEVKDWNSCEIFKNGVLLFCVDGEIYPKEILNATLSSEFLFLYEKLSRIENDEELFFKEKERAYEIAYDRMHEEEIVLAHEYHYDISPFCFLDNNIYVFAIKHGEQIRILISKMNYIKEISRPDFENVQINEAIITVKELQKMMEELSAFQRQGFKGTLYSEYDV